MSIKIPLDLNHPFQLTVVLPGSNFSAKADLRPVSPFTVTLERHSTTVSLVAQFVVTATLKMNVFTSVDIDAATCSFASNRDEDFESHIEIMRPAPVRATMRDDESVSAVFIFRPLTELGACLLAGGSMCLGIEWHIDCLRFVSEWVSAVETNALGFALLIPPVTVEVMCTVSVPMRITNIRAERRSIDLVFEGGALQPTNQRIHVPELERGASCTINIGILPLIAGDHRLNFWVEDGGRRVDPLFPTYISVVEVQ
jgi:hypothetical protein